MPEQSRATASGALASGDRDEAAPEERLLTRRYTEKSAARLHPGAQYTEGRAFPPARRTRHIRPAACACWSNISACPGQPGSCPSAAPERGEEISREPLRRTSAACLLRGTLPPPFPRAISSRHMLHAVAEAGTRRCGSGLAWTCAVLTALRGMKKKRRHRRSPQPPVLYALPRGTFSHRYSPK